MLKYKHTFFSKNTNISAFRMKNYFLPIFLFSVIPFSFSQNCNCDSTFRWLKETFENNDAGFQYAVDQKGRTDYQYHTEKYFTKIKDITGKEECAEALNEWLQFFRNGHLWFSINYDNNLPANEIKKPDPEVIRKQFQNWETFPYKEKEFNSYLSSLKEAGLEGIWSSPPYTIGIRKVNNEYIGFIIEADGIYWKKTQIKLRIKEENGKLNTLFYLQNHSTLEISNTRLIGNNYLAMDYIMLKRVQPVYPKEEAIERHLRLLSAGDPIFERITDKTVILRIPSFSSSEKKKIDSLIESNKNELLTAENLIIDLRYNGGGSDISFQQLLPLLYTNPIREVGVEYLSTPLNNKRMEEFLTEPDLSEEEKTEIKEALNKLNEHPGEFVNLNDDSSANVVILDTVYPFPKNIGIIINQGNGSTTEQFLLAAKQSKKVKLFGTTTAGVLDISNMYFVSSPCNNFKLGYCLTKSKRIPDFTIDGKGIQPDFYIDKEISEYKWIDFVNSILSN